MGWGVKSPSPYFTNRKKRESRNYINICMNQPTVKPLPHSKSWELQKDFSFVHNNKKYVIPKGTINDGATIPIILVPLLYSRSNPVVFRAALIHDYLFGSQSDSKEADTLFRDMIIEDGGNKIKAYILYSGIRIYRPLRTLSKKIRKALDKMN